MPKRKIVQIDEEKCTGCGLCIPNCAEGALQIIDGKAKLITEKFCDGLGACLGPALRMPFGSSKERLKNLTKRQWKSISTNRRKLPLPPNPSLNLPAAHPRESYSSRLPSQRLNLIKKDLLLPSFLNGLSN